ncbi:DUF4429 domain-containing protein [Leucobacter muris]|uniref:DUF4429 domain-containing protein n=1 Tax=Leucobacter muris TaxID=1935379 RepID=A0ABX5QDJ7_9MICO|nr:DUF4429 domain-containing protein [Leucobacter muris]QAB17137.1 DUF4429 domain-containing protein [Leucobacter muris]
MTALRADGFGGQIEVDGTTVKIHRAGWRSIGEPRQFDLADVSRIDFRPASSIANGYLRFSVPGEETEKPLDDPNHVRFTRKESSVFASLHAELDARLQERGELDPGRESAMREAAAQKTAADEARSAVQHRATVEKYQRKLAVAQYDGHLVRKGHYSNLGALGIGVKRSIAGATAEFESGAEKTRPTLTRIGAGALLAGPVGAVAGGMFKKDRTKGYVTIVFADGATVIIDGPAKDEKKMREFAARINQIAQLEKRWAAEPATADDPQL